jgi:hypothetical protein
VQPLDEDAHRYRYLAAWPSQPVVHHVADPAARGAERINLLVELIDPAATDEQRVAALMSLRGRSRPERMAAFKPSSA